MHYHLICRAFATAGKAFWPARGKCAKLCRPGPGMHRVGGDIPALMSRVGESDTGSLAAAAEAGLAVAVCDCSGADGVRLKARHGHWLSAAEQARLQRFTRPEPARLFLAGRILLRGSLAGVLGCEPADLDFGENAWGKPILLGSASPWQFNLSHSHGWLALALSRIGAVGVDTEYADRPNALPALARRYFSAHEQAWLAEVDGEAWRQRFFDIWTLKEAYIKAVGKGLAISLEGFGFTVAGHSLCYRHDSGESAPGRVQAWLSRAIAERPLACVVLPATAWAASPALVQVTLEGVVQCDLAWSAASPA